MHDTTPKTPPADAHLATVSVADLFREFRRLQAIALEKKDEESRKAFHDFIVHHGIGAGTPD